MLFGPQLDKELAKGKWKTPSLLSRDLDLLYEDVNLQKLILGCTNLTGLKMGVLKLGILGDTRDDQ